MGNTISMPKNQRGIVDSISMSNGLTSVLIEVLVISGSIIAESNRERELIIWLAQRDQSVVGIGTVGFDIDEMPWTLDHFISEKEFLVRTITAATRGMGWDRLSYKPRKDWVIDKLDHFKTMIDAFNRQFISMNHYFEWSKIDEDDENPTIPYGYPKCEKHLVYLSCHGCILCNNEI